jgi:hypothetical protein
VVGKFLEEKGMTWFGTCEGVMKFSSLNSSLLVCVSVFCFFYILRINWSSEEKDKKKVISSETSILS